MKTISLLTLAIATILAIGNINDSHAKNNPKTYKNVIENEVDRSTTISFFEGHNDQNLKPIKQCIIKHDSQGNPIEKIQYKWNNIKRAWVTIAKYDYIYDSKGKVENLLYSEWDEKTKSWSENVRYDIYLLDLDKELLTINDRL